MACTAKEFNASYTPVQSRTHGLRSTELRGLLRSSGAQQADRGSSRSVRRKKGKKITAAHAKQACILHQMRFDWVQSLRFK